MSVIDKYPFINAVLTSLSDEDLASLQECVNGAGGSSVFKSILAGSPYLLKNTDKGVYPIELEVAKSGTAQTVYPGFLIYNDDYCVLISFATERSQILTVLDLHLVNGLWSYEIKPFELSITDLRSELFDVAGGGSGGGGLTPEQEEKLDNSLQLPSSAPAAQQLVGINTSGEQNALGIGDGLVVDSNVLKNNTIIYLDFDQRLTIPISDELYTEIVNVTGKKLFIPYNLSLTNCAAAENLIFYMLNSQLVSIPRIYASGVSTDANGYYSVENKNSYIMTAGGTDGNHKLTIASDSNITTSIVKNQTIKFSQVLSSLTGTVGTWPTTPSVSFVMNLYKFAYKETSNLMVFFNMKYFDNSTKTFYGEAESATYKYTLTITTNTRAYTITQVAK